MEKRFIVVLSAMFLFLGVIIGFVFSPFKGGVSCGNNCGNSTNIPRFWPNEDDEDDCEDLPF